MNPNALTSPLQNPLFYFEIHGSARLYPKHMRFRSHSFKFRSFPMTTHAVPLRYVQSSVVSCYMVGSNGRQLKIPSSFTELDKNEQNGIDVAKPIAYALLCVVLGFFCPVFGFQKPAFAAVSSPAASELLLRKENEEKGHEYSNFTRRLLEDVGRLLKMIDEAKKSEKEDSSTKVKEGLKGVKATKRTLQEEIMDDLNAKLRVLKGERNQLMNRSEEIVEKLFKAKREEESLLRKAKGGGVRIQKLREERINWENEYDGIGERIDEIEDLISGKETMALSIGVRELLFIERECEALVEGFMRDMRKRATQR